jgi:hypothetical protein
MTTLMSMDDSFYKYTSVSNLTKKGYSARIWYTPSRKC